MNDLIENVIELEDHEMFNEINFIRFQLILFAKSNQTNLQSNGFVDENENFVNENVPPVYLPYLMHAQMV